MSHTKFWMKNVQNMDKISFMPLSMVFTAPIFTELILTQWQCTQILYNKLLPNQSQIWKVHEEVHLHP